MKRFYLLFPLLVGLLLPTATWADEDISIDATNFPDKAFRDFLTTQSYGEDGVLTENEITGDILDASIKRHREYSLCASASLREYNTGGNRKG